MSEQAPSVVRSSGAAMTASALLWLVFPTGWPTLFWGIALGVAVHDTYNATVNTIMLVIVGVPALLLWWLWWRFAGVCAKRRPDGIRVRGFLRSATVGWNRVQEVTSSEYHGVGKSFNFSWTVIVYRLPDGDSRRVRVSRSFRSGRAGVRIIRSWFPPRHPLHAPFPGPQVAVDLSAEPVLRTLRPSVLIRVLHTLAPLLILTPILLPLIGVLGNSSDPGAHTTLAIVSVALGLPVVWFIARIWLSHVDLTPAGMRNHGYFRTRDYPLAALAGFLVVPAGAGAMVSVELAGEGTRQLAVGAGFGQQPARVYEELDGWLRKQRARAGRPVHR